MHPATVKDNRKAAGTFVALQLVSGQRDVSRNVVDRFHLGTFPNRRQRGKLSHRKSNHLAVHPHKNFTIRCPFAQLSFLQMLSGAWIPSLEVHQMLRDQS